MEAPQPTAEELYLDLLKKCLTRYLFGERYKPLNPPRGSLKRRLLLPVRTLLAAADLELTRPVSFDPKVRAEGRDLPSDGETMVGLHRLDNLQDCVTDVLRRGVPGDLIETGVWRGGVTIFMRAILKAYGDGERNVWVADSFQGLPKPDPSRWPADAGDKLWTLTWVPTSLEVVQANFARYGLLDEQVRFLPGWFSDTLPTAPIERLAVLRLDGDMYGSTMEALEALYPKLSVGGYVIVDDYGAFAQCKEAVTDFRAANGIMDPMEWVDESCVFWQRS
jgi:O-methyltransferase